MRIDASSGPARLDAIALPETLGPLRSVQPATRDGASVLLIGAQSGIYEVNRESLGAVKAFAIPTLRTKLGFNRVALLSDGRLAGSHGDAGLVFWEADRQDAPSATLPAEKFGSTLPAAEDQMTGSLAISAGGARHLTPLPDGRVLFAVAGRLMIFDGKSVTRLATDSSQDVVGILQDGSATIIVRADGGIERWLNDDADKVELLQRRGSNVRAAATCPG